MKKLLLATALALGLISPALAVVQQSLMGNANYAMLQTDQRILTQAAFTAPRTLTLISAGATCINQTCSADYLEIVDSANAVNGANTLTITPATGETINGSSASLVLTGTGGRVTLIPISGSNWVAQVWPASLQIEASNLGGTWTNYRNILDNGAFLVQQRGTNAVTCATTAGLVATSYGADRWGCDVNVTSGVGTMTVVTTAPVPPVGFASSMKLVRGSGVLTQPLCVWQEIPTADVTALAGQNVTYSTNLINLGALSSAGGNVNFVIITGTGSDQGMGALRSAVTMTAPPAITPVWNGLATLQNVAIPVTTTWARYQAPPVVVPTTVTEMAVGLCFTPVGTGAATDGFAFVGVQLERGTIASPFEFRPLGIELSKVQRYYFSQTETASGVIVGSSGQGASTTTCSVTIPLLIPMAVAPTYASAGTALSASTWTITHVVTATALATPYLAVNTANTVNQLNLTATVASGLTAGQTCVLTGAGAGNIITASADF